MRHWYENSIFIEARECIKRELKVADDLDDNEIQELINEVIIKISSEHYINISEKETISQMLFNSFRRYDILQPLLDDEDITEIMVNGYNNIFIEKKGSVFKTELSFENSERLENVIQSIVSKVNRSINESSPIVDSRLPDGSRVNVVLDPIALNGPILTIRKFSKGLLNIEKLIEMESIDKKMADFLECLVKGKYNIFISGGTGSGKTTFLNVLSNFIPSDERIITIEDSAELSLSSVENLISLETRDANTEGHGAISMGNLIKSSLRMRPDRIVVGEVRGAEALDMLQAMNTGHDGSLSTGHANSAKDMLSRLETMVLSGAEIPIDAIRGQIDSAIDILIHLGRLRDKSRKVLEICELVGMEKGRIKLNSLYRFKELNFIDNKIEGCFVRSDNDLINREKMELEGLSID